MTGSMITTVLDECEQFSLYMRDFFKRKVLKYLRNKQLLQNDETKEFLDVFDFENPFKGKKTLDKQIEALRTKCGYINAPLDYRMDNAIDRESCSYIPKMVLETFQYVRIIDVLTLVLFNQNVREVILSGEKSPDGVIGSFIDGQHFKLHPLFSRFPHAIRLKLYYDEPEIVNPLGSKTRIHKLGVFYYQIQNMPAHMNSELSSIHVLFICSDADVKKYGFERILAPFFNDLLTLECDERFTIQIGEEEFVL